MNWYSSAVESRKILERIALYGIHSTPPADLVAAGFSRREGDVDDAEPTSIELLQRAQGIKGLADLSSDLITDAFGLEGFEVTRALALIELGRRIALSGKGTPRMISTPEDLANLLSYLRTEKKEHFIAVLLDAKNQIIRTTSIHIGTLTSSLVGGREVFREAIRAGASSLIVAHNHPSGDPTPSPEDIEVTEQLKKIGELLDIPLHDHVIIGDPSFVSLHTLGYL